jgi:hypothetical protein
MVAAASFIAQARPAFDAVSIKPSASAGGQFEVLVIERAEHPASDRRVPRVPEEPHDNEA